MLDAFSSDSPPIHLLTAEAVADEIRTVKPGGLVAFHVSNRYYDLSPAVAAAAARQGLTVLETLARGRCRPRAGRDAVALAGRHGRCEPRSRRLRAEGWTDAAAADRPFTDDYADLIRYLRLGS